VLERAALPPGQRVLAQAVAEDGTWLLGTRDALVVVGPDASASVPWEQVETADWLRDEGRLRVTEVGEFGSPQPVHVFSLSEPGSLLPMVRERVTASVLLQRRVRVEDAARPHGGRARGLLVVARRAPRGGGGISWSYQLDPGLDPADPAVQRAAEEGVRAAQEELGEETAPSWRPDPGPC
jgi:hypothetical protein